MLSKEKRSYYIELSYVLSFHFGARTVGICYCILSIARLFVKSRWICSYDVILGVGWNYNMLNSLWYVKATQSTQKPQLWWHKSIFFSPEKRYFCLFVFSIRKPLSLLGSNVMLMRPNMGKTADQGYWLYRLVSLAIVGLVGYIAYIARVEN